MTDGIVERSAPAPDPPTDPAPTSPIRRIRVAWGLRDCDDDPVAVLLPAYLVGCGAAEVGAIATIALAGSALTTIRAAVLGTRADTRLLLLLAAALMWRAASASPSQPASRRSSPSSWSASSIRPLAA